MLVALDFESDAIDTRPNYPPKPTGLAVHHEGIEPFYYAWGHPIENNCDYDRARMELAEYLENPENEFVFHNAPFDCSIIEEKMQLQVPWERVHDTMLLAFLHDPFGELSLKPLSDKLLGMPPEEQEAVREWLVAHGICRANDKAWGAHIAKAPGNLVGTYAKGDVVRTYKLYEFFMTNGIGQTKQIAPREPDTSKIGDGGAPW
jgi:DNA polymerase I-like protein with 3'-5' exonuclease and polymerase domains